MPSLARSAPKPLKVTSLARSVRAGVGAGAGAKEEEKKAISTQAVCTPPGSPSEARLVLTDGWMGDGWVMDGWVGKYLFLFCLFLENYLIYDANCFHAP